MLQVYCPGPARTHANTWPGFHDPCHSAANIEWYVHEQNVHVTGLVVKHYTAPTNIQYLAKLDRSPRRQPHGPLHEAGKSKESVHPRATLPHATGAACQSHARWVLNECAALRSLEAAGLMSANHPHNALYEHRSREQQVAEKGKYPSNAIKFAINSRMKPKDWANMTQAWHGTVSGKHVEAILSNGLRGYRGGRVAPSSVAGWPIEKHVIVTPSPWLALEPYGYGVSLSDGSVLRVMLQVYCPGPARTHANTWAGFHDPCHSAANIEWYVHEQNVQVTGLVVKHYTSPANIQYLAKLDKNPRRQLHCSVFGADISKELHSKTAPQASEPRKRLQMFDSGNLVAEKRRRVICTTADTDTPHSTRQHSTKDAQAQTNTAPTSLRIHNDEGTGKAAHDLDETGQVTKLCSKSECPVSLPSLDAVSEPSHQQGKIDKESQPSSNSKGMSSGTTAGNKDEALHQTGKADEVTKPGPSFSATTKTCRLGMLIVLSCLMFHKLGPSKLFRYAWPRNLLK